MTVDELTGYYTCRTLLNRPDPVDDFDRLRFAEAELFLLVRQEGTVTGTLAFPAAPGADEKAFMDVTGTVAEGSPASLHFTGRGRPNTAIGDYHYEYDVTAAHQWEQGVGQYLALVGTVVRVARHPAGTGDTDADAGFTASVVAVKRGFVDAREVPGVALVPEALTMLASRDHRLWHTAWHTVRNVWWSPLLDEDRAEIAALGWEFTRPPFAPDDALDLTNGAGEDFLFMHRRMISMVHDVYRRAGVAPIESWKTIPGPDAPQFGYVEQDDPTNPRLKTYRYVPERSGLMVPPAEPALLDLFPSGSRARIAFLKSPAYFQAVLRPHEQIFRSPRYLASLTLEALGNLIEFTVHNQMHMRWAAIPRDPETQAAGARGDFDFAEKWDHPDNDYLGDFYSSHVNPLFWRLHGWVDDRIEDWYLAHEAAASGEVRRRDYKGVRWFEPGPWVQAGDPFDRPDDPHGDHPHGGHGDSGAIAAMLAVLDIVRRAAERPEAEGFAARGAAFGAVAGITSFLRWLDA